MSHWVCCVASRLGVTRKHNGRENFQDNANHLFLYIYLQAKVVKTRENIFVTEPEEPQKL